MKTIYLLTTDHLEDMLWFREEEDFKVAMNYVAVQAAEMPDVSVLAFILMSNHAHFLLKGSRRRAADFVQGFKHRYSLFYRRKYGVKEFLRRNGLDIKPIPYEDEAPEKAAAYIQMNSVAANICAHPSQYPWRTGNTFFNPAPAGGNACLPSRGAHVNACCTAMQTINSLRIGKSARTVIFRLPSMWLWPQSNPFSEARAE